MLAVAESGSLKLVHGCFWMIDPPLEKSGELNTRFFPKKHVVSA
jgi:hypothetical protein